MKNTKHTQGEWRVGKPFTSRNKEHVPVLAEFGTIAITTPIEDSATEEDKANALLIAAAPDLLGALHDSVRLAETLKQEVETLSEQLDPSLEQPLDAWNSRIEHAKRAIQKATIS